jgi:hypothetical protein
MFPELTEAQMVYVADSLRRAIRENSRAGELTNIGQAGG